MLTPQRSCIAAVALLILSCFVLFGDLPSRRFQVDSDEDVLRLPAAAADRYTYVPTVMTTEEVQSLYPPHFQLKLVQIVHRHGERTPTTAHFKELKEHKHGWRLCNSPPSQSEFFVKSNVTRPSVFRLTPLNEEGLPPANKPGVCQYGQLTDKGKHTLFRAGAFLRHLYVDHLHFLPKIWLSADQLYIRATDIVRTHHSVLSLLLGLYPLKLRAPDLETPEIHVMPHGHEFLYPNDGCPKVRMLWLRNLEADKGFPTAFEKFQSTYPVVRHWLEQHPASKHPEVWGPTPLQAVDDTFTTFVAHGMPLPEGITLPLVDHLKRVTTREQYAPFQGAEELDHLAAGLLLRDIGMRIQAAVAGAAKPQLVIYSTHDSTVGPLLCALKCFDGIWPPFASTAVFELFAEVADPAVMHMRIVYNGKPLPLPYCAESSKAPYMCPLEKFQHHLNAMKFHSLAEYTEACKVPAKST